eukprot:1913186-Rhodomonas_salina.2
MVLQTHLSPGDTRALGLRYGNGSTFPLEIRVRLGSDTATAVLERAERRESSRLTRESRSHEVREEGETG